MFARRVVRCGFLSRWRIFFGHIAYRLLFDAQPKQLAFYTWQSLLLAQDKLFFLIRPTFICELHAVDKRIRKFSRGRAGRFRVT